MFKKISLIFLVVLSFVLLLSGCNSKDVNQLDPPKKGEQIAIMETSMGTIKFKFFPQYAPKAVENFITHAKAGYYNGMKFHRVIKDFMIQSGDPLGTGSGGESIWGKPFDIEVTEKLHNYRGALSMARQLNTTVSNGSQFFIVQSKSASGTSSITDKNVKSKYEEIGGVPSLDMDYTVFGQAFEGMDIVDKIAAVETTGDNPTPPTQANLPKTDVIIKTITIENN
jgi:peptidyl-prolyl cis-trans isomerase B (cyclophilin B)